MFCFFPLSPYLQQNRHPQFIFHNHHLKANPPRPPFHPSASKTITVNITSAYNRWFACLSRYATQNCLSPTQGMAPSHLPTSIGLHTNTQRQIRTALVHMQSMYPLPTGRMQGTGSRRPNGLICNCKREQHGLLVALRHDASSLGFPWNRFYAHFWICTLKSA